jgi:hypothetical protein
MPWDWFHKSRHPDNCRWALQTTAPGVLQVRSREAALRYDDLRALIDRLLTKDIDDTTAEIVFDFSEVRTITAPWTLTVAQLVDFSRRSRATCRIESLQGKPAEIVSMLLADGDFHSRLRLEETTPTPLN